MRTGHRRWMRMGLVLALVVGTLAAGSAGASPGKGRGDDGNGRSAEHRRVIEFWTNERVAQAIPRDFVRDPGTGRFSLKKPDRPGKPGGGGGGGGSTVVTGKSWNGGGTVDGTTGKVLFAMGGSYYVCSASVAADPEGNGRSVVLTAAHCAYDEAAGDFATNWMFVPDYDAAPEPLDTDGLFCDNTLYGCWVADALVVHQGYASAGGFNDQAVLYDFAFAVLTTGGKTGDLVEDVVGEQAITFTAYAQGADTYAFGYPAAGRYKGTDLVYCRAPLGFDPLNDDKTYRLDQCGMTGGSSGGPWMSPFAEGSGEGTLMSVNSYGYSGVKAMHGPIFNDATAALYDTATSGSIIDTVVGP